MIAEPLWEPYADGTMGQQGEASADAEPYRRGNIVLVHRYVVEAGAAGATSLEIERDTGRGHGGISGALSNLHRSGTIVRLAERRGRHGVYVLPEHVGGRQVVPYNRNKKAHQFADVLERLDAAAGACGGVGGDHWEGCWKFHAPCAFVEAARIVAGGA